MKKSKSKGLKLSVGEEFQHFGRCDSSGALALDGDHFAVADDEQNVISIYRANGSGHPLQAFNINDYFFPSNDEEVDIEGSTVLNGVVFWIASHGTNKDGESRPKRRQFFANRITATSDGWVCQQVGRSYPNLIADLIADPRWRQYDFGAAAQIAPKKPGGFNIEALAATPKQKLLIGLRNPIVDGKAIVIKLKNPHDLLLETTIPAQFSKPIELDLGGLGIRSMEYWPYLQQYLIVAGAFDGGDDFALYLWSGQRSETPMLLDDLLPQGFRPEGIVIYPERPESVQLISDDGAIERDGVPCKELPEHDRYFRSLWLSWGSQMP